MSEKSKTMLYVLTCIACVVWLAQTVNEYAKDGTLLTAPSIIFIVCILIAIIYTGISAFQSWRTDMKTQEEEEADSSKQLEDQEKE